MGSTRAYKAAGLYSIKPWFVRKLRRLEDALVARRVHPNAITGGAVGVSVLAGAALAAGGLTHEPAWWLAIPPLALARLALNALDGAVARRTGRGGPSGMVINELGDRVSDTAMMVPAGCFVRPGLVLGAVAAGYLTSITGLLGAAARGERLQGGPMGKADRVAVLAAAAVVAALLGSPMPIVAGLWTILCGSLLTTLLRTRALLARLRDD